MRTRLREEIGLLEAISITIGSIIGSGIFISPKGVVEHCGSVGLALVVWVLCGLQSMVGSMCYAELGTSMPGSGGDYHYLNQAFGPLPAFMYLWVYNLIFLPTTNAILALTFARYTFASFFPDGCVIPAFSIQLMACSAILFFTWLNMSNVKLTNQIQNAFMFGKLGALILIIITGILMMATGHTENYKNPWKNSTHDPSEVAVAFYSGVFSSSGWNTLNYVTEELKNPSKNLPRAIFISVPISIAIYLLTNMAYFSILSPADIHLSNAIAVSFGEKALGFMKWMFFLKWIPVFVAMSSLGGLSVHIMAASRILFVGARSGQFPSSLSLIQTKKLSPTPSLVFMAFLSVLYLSIPDVFVLINFSTFILSVVSLAVVIAMLYMRWKEPLLHRPIKVHLIHPITFLLICLFLVTFPIYSRPTEVLISIGIMLSSLPVYAFFISSYKYQPQCLKTATDFITVLTQKLFLASPED